MKPIVRTSLLPLSIILLVVALITSKWFMFGSLAVVLLIISVFFYSGRKQRIRYWVQGYKNKIESNDGNVKIAIRELQDDFCKSKYANEKVCGSEYENITALIQDVIVIEFGFKKLLKTRTSSMVQNMDAYLGEVEKLRDEIKAIISEENI